MGTAGQDSRLSRCMLLAVALLTIMVPAFIRITMPSMRNESFESYPSLNGKLLMHQLALSALCET